MTPWLTIIGVGLSGAEGLAAAARDALARAEVVAGAARLLDLLAVEEARRYRWPTPFSDGVAHVLGLRGRRVAVLATGDPMHFGIGATLAGRLQDGEYVVLPSVSAFSLAAAEMGWPLQDVTCLSLHGRPLEALGSALCPGRRIFVLTRDGDAPSDIMSLLVRSGYAESRVSVLENLGGSDAGRHDLRAEKHDFGSYAPLNVMAIDCRIDENVQYLPPLPGLPDGAFVNDGQLTKREVRAATLAALVPTPGARLWDVGAGCGSVAVEWLRAAPGAEAVAFERDEERVGMVQQNALRLGVPQLAVVQGSAPASLHGQAAPDAIFHGGALADDPVFEACWQALRSGGRLVANAVTLEGVSALTSRHAAYGGELVQIAVSHVRSVGRLRAMEPAMPVTQWRVVKP